MVKIYNIALLKEDKIRTADLDGKSNTGEMQ